MNKYDSSIAPSIGYEGDGLIKTEAEINGMRAAGKLAARTLVYACNLVKPGVTTNYINTKTEAFIRKNGALPAPLNYGGNESRPPYPKSICTSVNEVICHGIPGKYKLKEGDIICIDVTVILKGFHGDNACTVPVGKARPAVQSLMKDALACLRAGIGAAKAGARLLDVSRAIQTLGEGRGRGVVEEFVGHGIGRYFHEHPQVSHVANPHGDEMEPHDMELLPGMTFTIEPMINAGTWKSQMLEDGWTALTADRQLSAQYEHTILITDQGAPEILTRKPGSKTDAPAGYEP